MITEEEYQKAVEQHDAAQRTMNAYHAQKADEFDARWERWKKGERFADEDLVYSATNRCTCGSGLAYPKGCGPRHEWTCSDVLTHRVNTNEGHASLPFSFYEIKSELQPSAHGATTRPESSSSND